MNNLYFNCQLKIEIREFLDDDDDVVVVAILMNILLRILSFKTKQNVHKEIFDNATCVFFYETKIKCLYIQFTVYYYIFKYNVVVIII
jgi:hypothetical protein